MSINVISIDQVSDLKIILDVPIFIAGSKALQDQETAQNMWAISINSLAKEDILIGDLNKFVDDLVEKRKEQVSQMGIVGRVLFYMWFDEMAGQLRFNTISTIVDRQLPFGCEVAPVKSSDVILKDFLASQYHAGIPWSELEELENNLEENEQPFILKMFFEYLN